MKDGASNFFNMISLNKLLLLLGYSINHKVNGSLIRWWLISLILSLQLLEDTLAPFLLISCLDYVRRTSINLMKENGLKLKNTRSKRCPAKTIMYADYADDLALLTNIPPQAECSLHSLEQAAKCIGLFVYADKNRVHVCLNKTMPSPHQMTNLSNLSTNSHTSVKISHLLKLMSTYI